MISTKQPVEGVEHLWHQISKRGTRFVGNPKKSGWYLVHDPKRPDNALHTSFFNKSDKVWLFAGAYCHPDMWLDLNDIAPMLQYVVEDPYGPWFVASASTKKEAEQYIADTHNADTNDLSGCYIVTRAAAMKYHM